MIEHRHIDDIKGTQTDWLRARHHFALGPYGNPEHKAVGSLYVWNDDEIAPRSGFPPHGHSNVEIVTYVREGVVTHEDNLGNISHINAGDVQVMSAGSGIRHSERNDGATPARLFQIWLSPRANGGEPAWGTRPFPKRERAGRFVLLASRTGRDGSLPVRSDAAVLGAVLPAGTAADYELSAGEGAYIVPAAGAIDVNGAALKEGEGAAIRNERHLHIAARSDAELVMVVTRDAPHP